MLRLFRYSAVREFHSVTTVLRRANPFLYPNDISDLSSRIKEQILTSETPVTEETAIEALQACKDLQQQLFEESKLGDGVTKGKLAKELEAVLLSKNVQFDQKLLKKSFLLKFPPQTVESVISCYYQKNPNAVIPKELALIPFRNCLFSADLRSALKITDLTTGHPNYIKQKEKTLKQGVLQVLATAIGVTLFSKVGVQQVIEIGWLSPSWKHLSSINAMILTYLLNSSFFLTIVNFGRQLSSAGGDYLTWQKGTFYTHWYKHADEMSMCTKIMEVDAQLNGGQGNSVWLVEELCRKREDLNEGQTLTAGVTRDGKKVRLLEPKDNIEDLKMQAYWMSGGDGFEWVEPDQDPAEIVWRRHLESAKSSGINGSDMKSLKWTDDLIEEKST